MRPYPRPGILIAVLFALSATLAHSEPGLGDKLKKKAEDKANKSADDAINKSTETPKDADAAKTTSAEAPASSDGAAKGDATAVSAVSTKFDFVPGDKVLLFDDFSQDELGDFPAHWKLNAGTVDVKLYGFGFGPTFKVELDATTLEVVNRTVRGRKVPFESLSIEWPITGDDNANGVVTVRFRKQGATSWRTGRKTRRERK